ncbi:MAG: hypothetical protein WAP28_02895 [Tepidanaerobacteraceae bacterium]
MPPLFYFKVFSAVVIGPEAIGNNTTEAGTVKEIEQDQKDIRLCKK